MKGVREDEQRELEGRVGVGRGGVWRELGWRSGAGYGGLMWHVVADCGGLGRGRGSLA